MALYIESFGNHRKFARTVRALARRKPVLAVKSGRSTAGRRAGASHTAGEIDALSLAVVATRSNPIDAILAAMAPVVDAHELTTAAVVVGAPTPPVTVGGRRIPVFNLPERAVTALDHAARYAAWRRKPLGKRVELSDVDTPGARHLIDNAIANADGWQPFAVTDAILRGGW